MTIQEKIKELRAVYEKATPGSWIEWNEVICTEIGWEGPEDGSIICFCRKESPEDQDEVDAHFIATARNEFEGLLNALEIAVNAIHNEVEVLIKCFPQTLSPKRIDLELTLTKIQEAMGVKGD